jgi:hypothetical protein
MTSKHRLETNRANATMSSGPRTHGGKARASQNARKHGLAMPIAESPMGPDIIERLARAIAGERTEDNILALARVSAAAELELVRVRSYKASVMEVVFVAATRERSQPVEIKEHHEDPTEDITVAPLLDQLEALERYERRAFSRRKTAFRRLAEL